MSAPAKVSETIFYEIKAVGILNEAMSGHHDSATTNAKLRTVIQAAYEAGRRKAEADAKTIQDVEFKPKPKRAHRPTVRAAIVQ